MTDTTELVESLNRRLLSAATVVSEARLTVERGNFVNLSGLEAEADAICKELAKIPSGEGEGLKSALVGLADDLDRLTGALAAAHKKLAKEIGALGNRRRAAKAYFLGRSQD
jgi:hypothetical protein